MKYTKFFLSLFVFLFSLNTLAVKFCADGLSPHSGKIISSKILSDVFPSIKALKQLPPEVAGSKIIEELWKYEKRAGLEPKIQELILKLKSEKIIPALEKIDEREVSSLLYGVFKSEFYSRGYINSDFKFSSWDKITQLQSNRLAKLPFVKTFKSETFRESVRKITKTELGIMKNLEFLFDNSKALNRRIELIEGAQKSIKLMTWGFHDDASGKLISDAMISKKKQGIEVKVIVDYLTSLRGGYHNELRRMENSGIEVIYWKGKENPFSGMHAKLLLVDDKKSIEGGRNIGDHYLQDQDWSDLDLYHEGEVSKVENFNIFSRLWNRQINLQSLSFKKLGYKKRRKDTSNRKSGVLLSYPKRNKTDMISDLSIYAINNARKSIDIANAYIILTPGFENALKNALQRGVKVRVISNSMESVDEPIVSIPIQKSLKELYLSGAEVYLKKGKTIHTKMLKVDDFGWVGSYNIHPRSTRLEVEKIVFSTQDDFNQKLANEFEKSLQQTSKVKKIENFGLPGFDEELNILFSLIFNQL